MWNLRKNKKKDGTKKQSRMVDARELTGGSNRERLVKTFNYKINKV